ncbi:hypothetical protein CKW46_17485 [Mycobacterium liflandii]|nr:hypothetical protein [Mycobacterium pseudoshottsii]ULL10994.1 hypothetical protein CKW46_17485 [Mycobacterium liflandii]GAQ36350.1 hypothetical protein MPS_3106 [Mycobacterium pseudoshottsii JCM 15466]
MGPAFVWWHLRSTTRFTTFSFLHQVPRTRGVGPGQRRTLTGQRREMQFRARMLRPVTVMTRRMDPGDPGGPRVAENTVTASQATSATSVTRTPGPTAPVIQPCCIASGQACACRTQWQSRAARTPGDPANS